MHWVSASCGGEKCSMCGAPATHKVGEEIQRDDPNKMRHNFTAYVCCNHFMKIFGRVVPCGTPNAKVSGAGTASAGLPGYADGGNGERK